MCDSLYFVFIVVPLEFHPIIAQAVSVHLGTRVSAPSDQSACHFAFRVTLHISAACTGFLQQVPSPTSTQYVPQNLLPWWSKTEPLMSWVFFVLFFFVWCYIIINIVEGMWNHVSGTRGASNFRCLCWGNVSLSLTDCVTCQAATKLKNKPGIPACTQSPEHHRYFWKGTF